MPRRKRMTALLLCAGMVLVLLLSSAFIACEADHDCSGEACAICKWIAQTEALLQSFALLGVILLAALILPAVFRAPHVREEARGFAVPTPVGWKVRLND